MEPIFRKEFEINDLYVDCFGRLKPSAILFLAQEAAGHHCLELGLSWEQLAQKGLFWAVVRHRVQITRLPRRGETVMAETWPMPTTRTAYPRALVIRDREGNELLRLISLWVLMDLNTRAMILPGKSGVEVLGTLRGTELTAPRAIATRTMERSVERTVLFSDVDRNGHMNNTKYLDWVQDLLPSAFHEGHSLREMTVCYMTESREGQTLDLGWTLTEDGTMQVDGTRNGERIFAALLQFESGVL
jgi:acyl-ACP thioesterase